MTRFATMCLALLLLLPSWAGAQAQKNLAKQIAPLVDQQTIAVFHVNLEKVDVSHVIRSLAKTLELPEKEAQEAEKNSTRVLQVLRGLGATDVYAVFSLANIPFDPVFVAIPTKDNAANAAKLQGVVKQILRIPAASQVHGFVVGGSKNLVRHLEKMQPQKNTRLTKAFAEVQRYDAQLVVVLPEKTLAKALKEVMPQLPPQFGGGSTAALIKSFGWVTAGVNFKPKMTLDVTVHATNPKAARHIHKVIKLGLNVFVEEAKSKGFPLDFAKLKRMFTPKVEKNQLVLRLDHEKLIPLLKPMAGKMRLAASRQQSQNNLKQIVLALHNYYDLNKHFPTMASYSKNGKPLLSWRVHILPFVEQNQLYKQFKLDEPWDSPHNKKLIAKMPMIFRSPNSKAAAGKTTYLAPVGKRTIFGKKPAKFQDIRDGTSNTIIVVEANDDKAVYWTKPADLPIDPKNPTRGLGNKDRKVFNAAFADGSVRVVPTNIAAAMLYALFTKDGGEVVNLNR